MTAIEFAGMLTFAASAIGGLIALTMLVPWLGILAICTVFCAMWSLYSHAAPYSE